MAASTKESSPNPKTKLSRKRKATKSSEHDEEEDEVAQKRSAIENFSVAEFKVYIKDPNTAFSALEKFVTCARGFPKTVDIVEGYCQTSPDCKEIFTVLEAGRRKPSELQHILQCLECILLRLADDLVSMKPVSQTIVRRILTAHLPSVYFILNMRNKSSQIKCGLHLLTAMVMQGTEAARDILLHFNFQHPNIQSLFERRDRKDLQDVRTSFIQFLLSFLVVGDDYCIQQLMESKGLLNGVFNNMDVDKLTTIQLTLPTIKEKIVENAALSKTVKVRVFNEKSLAELMKLYNWKGPSKWQLKDKKKGKSRQAEMEMEEEDYADTSEDRAMVRDMVHDFLLSLCCSIKTGINFHDKTMGTTKNMNHMLTSMLSSVSMQYNDELLSQLVVEVLTVCPDQLVWFLPSLRSSLQPRSSPAWLRAMGLLQQVLSKQPPVSPVLKFKDAVNKTRLAKMVVNTLLPPKEVWAQVMATLQSSSCTVKHEGLKVMLIVLQRLRATLENCDMPHPVYSSQELADLRTALINVMGKALPNISQLVNCWNDVINPKQTNNDHKKEENVTEVDNAELVKGIDEVPETTFLLSILQVLCAYQVTLPEAFREHSLDFSSLLEGVRTKVLEQQASKLESNDDDGVADDADEEDASDKVTEKKAEDEATSMLQLHLLQLLAQSDIQQLAWMKKSFSHRSTLYLLLEMAITVATDEQLKDAAVALLIKLLQGTGAFEGVETELEIWLQQLTETPASETPEVLSFLEKVVSSVLLDPHTYIERVIDMTAEHISQSTQAGIYDSASVTTTSDALFDMIVSMDDVDLSDMVDTQTIEDNNTVEDIDRLPFSVLVPASLDVLKETTVAPAVETYYHSVMGSILCQQQVPEPLCLLLLQHNSLSILNSHLRAFVNVWLNDDNKMTVNEGKTPKKVKGLFAIIEHCIINDTSLSKLIEKGLENLKLSDVLPLTRRLLLLLRLLLNGDTEREKLDIIAELLRKICRHLQSEDIGGQTSERDERLVFLDTSGCSAVNTIQGVYKYLLNHPDIQQWFLFSGKIKHKVKRKNTPAKTAVISTLVADVVSSLSVDMHKSLGTELEFFKLRLIQMVESGDSHCEHVLHCLVNLTSILNPSQLRFVTEKLLLADGLVSASQLTQLGKTVLITLKRYLNIPRLILSSNPLSHEAAGRVMFLAAQVVDFDGALNDIVGVFPALVTVVTKDYIQHCLETGRPSQLDLLAACLLLSPACRYWFCDWATQAKLKLKHCAHYAPVLLSFLTSANTRDKGSEKLVKKIASIVIKDPEGWLSTTEVNQQEFVKKLLMWTNTDTAVQLHESLLRVFDESSQQLELLKMLEVVTCHLEQSSLWPGFLLCCVKCLLTLLSDKSTRDPDTLQATLQYACSTLKKKGFKISTMAKDLRSIWSQFSKQCLRLLYMKAEVHELLSALAEVVYAQASMTTDGTPDETPDVTPDETPDVTPDVKTLHSMLLSHSAFLTVMLNDDQQHNLCKEKLVQFLLTLVSLDKSCCETSHLSVLLGAYSASLSNTDRTILSLMQQYEQNKCDMKSLRPYLWGIKAVEQHSLKKKLGASLWRQPSMEQVVEALDVECLQRSILHFPLSRSSKDILGREQSAYWHTDVYDPLFMLPLFAHLLSPGYLAHCFKFVENHCLGYCLAALSSHDTLVRGAACHVLHMFHQQLESSRLTKKDVLLYLLKLLKNSMEAPASKLSPIISVFLAKAAYIVISPDDKFYRAINAFLLLKPKMDFANVPEFYKLFNSTELQFKSDRSWMLNLLRDGLRETSDYRIYEKRSVLKLLLAFHDSPLSDTISRGQVLEVLCRACQLKTVALDLVKNRGFLGWISALIHNNPCSWSLVIQLVTELWFTMLGSREPDSSKEAKQACLPVQFTAQMLQVMLQLIMTMRISMSLTDLSCYLKCLASIVNHYHKTVQLANGQASTEEGKLLKSVLSVSHVLTVLHHWCLASRDQALLAELKDMFQWLDTEMPELKDQVSDKEASTDTPAKEDCTGTALVDLTDILSSWKAQPTSTNECKVLLFLANWLLTCLLEKTARDTSRWLQFAVWFKHLLNSEDFKVYVLTNPSGAQLLSNVLNMYNDCSLVPYLNDIYIQVFRTSLQHKAPAELHDLLSAHFAVAMKRISKQLQEEQMQELLTGLVMEVKTGAHNTEHFNFLLGRF